MPRAKRDKTFDDLPAKAKNAILNQEAADYINAMEASFITTSDKAGFMSNLLTNHPDKFTREEADLVYELKAREQVLVEQKAGELPGVIEELNNQIEALTEDRDHWHVTATQHLGTITELTAELEEFRNP